MIGALLRSLAGRRRIAGARRLFDAGVQALGDQRYADAASDLAAAIEAGVDAPDRHLRLADAHRGLNDPAAEAGALARALDELPAEDAARPALMLRRGGALIEARAPLEAERCYRALLELRPDYPEALLCLATLREEENLAEARALMDRYVRVRPDAAARLRRALMLPAILDSNEEIDRVRAGFERELDELLAERWPAVRNPEFEIGSTAFMLAYHGRDDRALMEKLARVCRAVYPADTVCERRPFASGRRLRVGVVSSYLYSHSVARTTFGFCRDLPRERFEVFVFSIEPRSDDWSEAIRRDAEHYVELPLDLASLRTAIAGAALDVLYYTDIGMNPFTYFLAYWRLAPVQLVSWGHPVTSGIDTIDGFVSADAIEAPGSESQYSERLVRLPGFFLPRFRRPQLDAPRAARAALGLPTDRHLYLCLQHLFKLHPEFDLALRDILERDPRGEIVLLESNPRHWMDRVAGRMARTLGPRMARVRFVPRMASQTYLQHVAAADVILDPFHFGGGNSSYEPLALGVPVATLPAFQLRGRFTLGLYLEMGIDDCVAGSPGDFSAIAVRLACEPDFRAEVSERIAERCEVLFDRPDAGCAFGEALLRIVEEGAVPSRPA